MDDIAREARISKGLLYYHFKSKEHLLLEVQSLVFRRISERIQSASVLLGPTSEGVVWALDEMWKFLHEAAPIIPILMDMALRSVHRKRLRNRLIAFFDEQRAALTEGITNVLGPLQGRLGVRPEDYAEGLLALLCGLGFTAMVSEPPARVEKGFEAYRDLIQQILMLKARPEEGKK